ncbi:cell division protein SepF [Plantactinospora solaniradicis]|uniref:Cell division protein SepF n=1 Tax=Plantactinospora solaniradicis TaxID=1723736 RepID=A0ABW1KBY3_9ACTN
MVKTLHPRSYDEVIHVGHYFCHGFAVVMDLTSLTDADAMPLVDFAAGLVVGRDGAMERVAPKVFLLRPRETFRAAAQHPA